MLQQKSSHLRPGGLFSTSQSHLGPLLRSASLGFDRLDADICTATGRTGASHTAASGICSAVFGLISDFAVFQGFKCRAGESEEFFFSPSSAMVCLRSATSCQRLCLPVGPQCGLSSASRRKSACQLGRFHLIKLTPFAPVCLSVPPSQ